MKILHIGLCANGHPYNGIQQSLSKVSNYYEIPTNHPNINSHAMEMCDRFKPDVVFMQIQAPNIIKPETVRYMRKTAKVFNWTGDVRSPIPDWYYSVGRECSATLFSNMVDVLQMRRDGMDADYLQIGIDPEIFCPEGEYIKCEDIIFLGTHYDGMFPLTKDRYEMVRAMKEEFGDRFGVYGGNWGKWTSGNLNGDQISEAALYRGCKIAINFSHFNYKRYFSDRMIRITGSGAFCLSHDYVGIREDWNAGEIETFSDTKELIEKCHYFLKPENDDLRKSIKWNSTHKTHCDFTYDAMVENLLILIEKYE